MPIYGYVGLPRSGKSYSVVENVIIPALQRGRTIYHNMKLRETQLRLVAGDKGQLIQFKKDCTPDELVAGAPPGALIVIDESMRYWPAGIKANEVPPHQKEFFSEHGHRVGEDGIATDIVIIAQELGTQCAAFIRALIEVTYFTRKLSHFGLKNSYRISAYNGCIKGDEPPERKQLNTKVKEYREQIFACYVSHTQSVKGVAGEELVDEKASIWKGRPARNLALAVMLSPLLFAACAKTFHDLRGDNKKPPHSEPAHQLEESQPEQQRLATAPPLPLPPPPAPPAPPAESTRWRLAGRIVIDNLQFYVAAGATGQRFIRSDACRFDDAQNMTCLVDGEIVAEWTGPRPAQISDLNYNPQISLAK